MQTVTFGYNILRAGSAIIFSFLFIIFLIAFAFNLDEPNEWLIFVPIAVIIFCIIRFFILNFSLPMLKGKPALILDNEKLVSSVQDETIYWKNVAKFSKQGGILSYGYFFFELKNGEIFRIGTKWVEGSTNTIFYHIQGFMAHISQTN
jgi:hypothetical protein